MPHHGGSSSNTMDHGGFTLALALLFIGVIIMVTIGGINKCNSLKSPDQAHERGKKDTSWFVTYDIEANPTVVIDNLGRTWYRCDSTDTMFVGDSEPGVYAIINNKSAMFDTAIFKFLLPDSNFELTDVQIKWRPLLASGCGRWRTLYPVAMALPTLFISIPSFDSTDTMPAVERDAALDYFSEPIIIPDTGGEW